MLGTKNTDPGRCFYSLPLVDVLRTLGCLDVTDTIKAKFLARVDFDQEIYSNCHNDGHDAIDPYAYGDKYILMVSFADQMAGN